MLHRLLPREIQIISQHTETLAKKHLKGYGSTLTFRLVILIHGGIWQGRKEMAPVYRTVYGVCEMRS
jgi:hypothetical protein